MTTPPSVRQPLEVSGRTTGPAPSDDAWHGLQPCAARGAPIRTASCFSRSCPARGAPAALRVARHRGDTGRSSPSPSARRGRREPRWATRGTRRRSSRARVPARPAGRPEASSGAKAGWIGLTGCCARAEGAAAAVTATSRRSVGRVIGRPPVLMDRPRSRGPFQSRRDRSPWQSVHDSAFETFGATRESGQYISVRAKP